MADLFSFEQEVEQVELHSAFFVESFQGIPRGKPLHRESELPDAIQKAAGIDGLTKQRNVELHEDRKVRVALKDASHTFKYQRLASFRIDLYQVNFAGDHLVERHGLYE